MCTHTYGAKRPLRVVDNLRSTVTCKYSVYVIQPEFTREILFNILRTFPGMISNTQHKAALLHSGTDVH